MREIIVRIAQGHAPGQEQPLLHLLMDEIKVIHSIPLNLPELSDPKLREITQHLREYPDEKRTLKDWAGTLGTTPRTLIRAFKQQTGMTFREYRRQVRLMIALERLAQGDSVTRVAYDVGYDSPSAFIEVFRKVMGSTPGKYFNSP